MAEFNSIQEMMQNCAAQAVDRAQQEFGFSLDYSEASLRDLETILACVAVSLPAGDKDAVEREVKLWGAYFGEVALRQFGGAWDLVVYPGGAVAVPTLVMGGSQLYPLMKLYRRLTMGEAENVWLYYQKIRPRLSPVYPIDDLTR